MASINLYEVSGINNLSGFQTLTEIAGDLTIRECEDLESLSGLENIEVISGEVEIYDNKNLPTSALSVLSTIDIQGPCTYRSWGGYTRSCF